MGMSGTVLLLALLASLPYTWLHCLMMEAGSLTNLQVCHVTVLSSSANCLCMHTLCFCVQAAVVTTLLKSLQPVSDIDHCVMTLAYSLGAFLCQKLLAVLRVVCSAVCLAPQGISGVTCPTSSCQIHQS